MRLSVFVFSFFLSCFVYTQEKILQFGHSGRISTYAISQDNLSLATGGFDDGKVILWDINLRAIKQVFQTYGNAIDDIVFSEDNKKMACIDGGGNIFIWNIISQKLEFQFEPGKYGPTKMKSLTSKNLTPSKSIINGGKLIFIEDSLYVGSNFTYNGVQSSLFKISLDDGKVMAMGNIPEIQNTFINIKRLEKVDDKALIIYSNPNFFEHYVFIYSTLTEDIERYIFKSQKDKIEDISINSKQGLLAISIEKNNYDDNETLVFDLQTGKKVDKINEYGKLTWEGNNLWIGHIDTFKNYNFSARRFENQFEFQGFVRDFNYLSKHQKILVQNNEGLTLIEPLKFNLITHTNRWEGKKKNGIQCQYITHMEFLDDQNILVQSGETFHCNTSSQNLGKYIWDSKYNTFKEVFAGQKQSIIRGYNKKRKLVFGNYLDSTKIQKNFIGKEEFVYSTSGLDIFEFKNNSLIPKYTFDSTNNLLNVNGHSDYMFTLDVPKTQINLVSFTTGDTIATIKNQEYSHYFLKTYYDPLSGNIGIYNNEGKNMKFYNVKNAIEKPFYEFEFDRLNILAFDSKKRLLIKDDEYDEKIINLAKPKKSIAITHNISKIAEFHPTQPWIFYAVEDYKGVGLMCYDYNQQTIIGGSILPVERYNNSYDFEINDININYGGTRLLVKLNNNNIYVLELSGDNVQNVLTNSNLPITKIQQQGGVLSLNNNVTNLSNFQHEVDFEKGITNLTSDGIINYSITSKGYSNNSPTYLIKTAFNENLKTKTTDSTVIDSSGVNRFDRPIAIFDDRYLFLEKVKGYNSWDRIDGLKIFDIQEKKVLLEKDDIFIKNDFNSDENTITFYSRNQFYTWDKKRQKLSSYNIASKNHFYISFDAPDFSCIRLNDRSLLKSQLTNIVRYHPNNSVQNDTLSIPDDYTRVMLMSKLSDSLIWTTVFSKSYGKFGIVPFNGIDKKWGEFRPLSSRPIKILVTKSKDFLIVVESSGAVHLRNPNSGDLLAKVYQNGNGEIIGLDEDEYYCSSNPMTNVYLTQIDGEIYYDKFLDIEFNRPDIVLKSIGKSDNETVTLYNKAYELRKEFFESMNTSSNISDRSMVSIDYDKQSFNSDKNMVKIHVKKPLQRNKVIKTVNGQNIKQDEESIENIQIPVGYGENHIELIQNNSRLAKELKISSRSKTANENLFVYTISVSKYQNSNYNLTYATKDGKDLIKAFKRQSDSYKSVVSKELYDEDVTKENIEALLTQLNTGINDKVVIFLSGHGLLDENDDFYFATYDIDFDNPKIRGMGLKDFQKLLSKLNSHKKLLLIDSCYSGLVDTTESSDEKKSDIIADDKPVLKEKQFATKGAVATSMKTQNQTSAKSAFLLMQNVFSSFSSTTGLETITAASGNSVALESSRWQNGSFTYTIKLGLLDYKADEDSNGIISVNELKNYILKTVPIITGGSQQPTSRESNKYLNWDLWY